jgi:hypothetical protein
MMPFISILIRKVLLIGTHRYLSQNRNAKWVSSKKGKEKVENTRKSREKR